MAGEAGNVQLKLQASLDLAYMQGQLASLGAMAKRVPLNIVPTIDSRKLKEVLVSVNKEVVVKVNDSAITGLVRRLKSAKANLVALQAETSKIEVKVSGQASVTPKEARKIRAGVYRGIMSNGGKILLPVGLQPVSDTAVSKFKADLQKKLGSITIEVEASVRQSAKQGAGGKSAAQIDAEVQEGLRHIQEKGAQRFAGTTGVNVTEAAVREQLRSNINALTVAGLKKLAKQMQVTNYSGLNKAPLIDKIVADASYEMIKKYLNVQAMMQRPNRGPLQQVNVFVDSVRRELNAAIRQVRVEDFGTKMQTALPQARIAGLLPAARSAREPAPYSSGLSWEQRAAARTAQAYARSALRTEGAGGGGGGDDGPGGSQRLLMPARGVPADRVGQLRQYATALQVARQSMANFRASQLPLLGGLRELTGEFANAAKQVLLYGTAYRGLAFLAALPGNMLNAAKAQQQYNNALQVATQESGTFAKELLFVDNVQRAFGLNLQTTRDGFVRLYASMSPAGFDSGSIEKLFTGISAATAALQLTPDRAERVIYAFGQMASKGQVMSEELKGQLGDVLPGALAIFAKAAGKSVKEFNADLEKGVYNGTRFRELMTSVTDELLNRFSSGAVVAGRSLQGMLNVLQSDFQRTLESLSPLADSAAKALLLPLSGGLRQFSAAAQIATGELDRLKQQMADAQQVVKDVRDGGGNAEQIRAAERNAMALQARYEVLNRAMQNPAIAKQAADIQRFTAELAKAGTFVLNMAKTIGSVLQPVLAFFGTNLTSVIGTLFALTTGFQVARVAMMAALTAMTLIRVAAAAMGLGQAALSARGLATAFGVLGVQASAAQLRVVGLRFALTALVASTVVGAVIAGIGLLIGHFVSMGNAAQAAGEKAKAAMDSVREAALTGNVAMADAALEQAQLNARDLGQAGRQVSALPVPQQRVSGGRFIPSGVMPVESLPLTLRASLTSLGVNMPATGMVSLKTLKRDIQQQQQKQKAQIPELTAVRGIAQRRAKAMGLGQPGAVPPIAEADTTTDEARRKAEDARQKALDKAQADLERLNNQRQQLLTATADHEAGLRELNFNKEQSLAEERYENAKGLIDAEYDYRLTRANEVQAVQLNLEKKLAEARLNSAKAIEMTALRLDAARLQVENAQAKRAAAEQAGALALDTTSAPSAPVLPPPAQGDQGVYIAQTLQSALRISAAQAAGIVGNFMRESGLNPRVNEGGAVGMPRGVGGYGLAQWTGSRQTDLVRFAGGARQAGDLQTQLRFVVSELMGPEANALRQLRGTQSPEQAAVVFDKYYERSGIKALGERQANARSVFTRMGGAPASGPVFSMQRREQGIEFSVEQAEAEERVAKQVEEAKLLTILLKDVRQTAIDVASVIGQVLPVEQLKLENQLLAERNQLTLAGAPEEVIQSTEKLTTAKAQAAGIEAGLLSQIAKTKEENARYKDQLDKNLISESRYALVVAQNTWLIEKYEAGLAELPKQMQAFTLQTLSNTLAQIRNADAIKAVEEAVAMVEGAVSGAISSYKGFVSEVLQGGDIREAAQKLQSALSEQVITMFLDFSMKPMQQFFEKELKRIFNLPDEEALRAQEIQRLEALIAALDRNTAAITSPPSPASAAPAAQGAPLGDQSFNTAPWTPLMAGGSAQVAQVMRGSGQSFPLPTTFPDHGFPAGTFKVFEDALRRKREAEALQQMAPAAPMPPVPSIVPSSTIAPTAEALAPVTEAIKATGDAAATAQPQLAAGAQQFKWTMGTTVQAFGMAVGAITSIVAGISQMKKGGVSGVLGGLGSIFMGVGGAIGGFSNMFKPAAPVAAAATGFKLFANGGVVHGPTLGMVGEGRYSEAVVPLPDGRNIPVQMRGGSASRELLNDRSAGGAASPILSMSFQSTRFGGKDYVDVEQLEQAMAETERRAVRGGATRGASLALDRLQHSPTTRKKVGLR
jgi:tape measure domain-containing protein